MDVTSHVPIPIFGLILAVHHDSGAKERLTKKKEKTGAPAGRGMERETIPKKHN
jgi:hypothetical protein